MRLFSMPSNDSADGVVVDPLPGVIGTVESSLVHVPTGATIEHAASQHRQMLVVVVGSAVVEAADHPPVELGPGTLLLWEKGEVERTRATTDLLAVVMDCVGMLDLAGRFPELTVASG